MIANTWYCIAKTSTFDTGCTINVAFDGYDIQFSASVKFGMSAINITRCNIPYDTVFSLRLREGASQWFVDIFCNKEITPNVTIADSPYWAKVSTTAGEGNVILVLNDISSKYNTEQGGGTGGLDIDQLKSYLDDNGYTEAKNFWSKEGDETIRTRHNIVVDKGGAFGRGSETNITFGRLDNWEDWDASTMMFYTLSASLGVNLNERLKYIEQNGSGLNEDDLRQYLTSNNYLQEADIADLRVTVKGLDDILNGNVGGVIDSWNEVVAFLDGYSQSDDLASILSGMNSDIANRVLYEDFEKLEEAVNPLFGYFDATGSVNNALKLGGHSADYFATADALNTHITAFNTYKTTTDDRLNKLEALWFIDEDGNVRTTHNIVVEGGGAFGMGAESGGSTGGLGSVTIKTEGGIEYKSDASGVVTVPNWITASALNGYATESYVTTRGYITGITSAMVTNALGYTPYNSANFTKATIKSTLGIADWALAASKPTYAFNEITGKPTTLGGYGITDFVVKNTSSLDNTTATAGIYRLSSTAPDDHGYGNAITLRHLSADTFGQLYISYNMNIPKGGVHWRGATNDNTTQSWRLMLDESNYSSYALPLSGGTIGGGYGYLQIKSAADAKLSLNNTDSDNKYQFIEFLQNDVRYGYLGTLGNDDLYWNENVIIHSGNIGSYNAGSATKLQTARSIWGQSFDGSGDVDGYFKSASTDLRFYYNTDKLFIQAASTALIIGEGTSDIGTYINGKELNFLTGGSTKFKVTSGGNVLIGTIDDNGSKLRVNGTAPSYFYNSSTRYSLVVDGGLASKMITFGGWNHGEKAQVGYTDNIGFSIFNYQSYRNNNAGEKITGVGITDTGIFYVANSGDPGPSVATLKVETSLVTVIGNLTVTGGGAFGSDVRYKNIINYTNIDLATIANAPLFTFRWNDREDKATHLGTSAQYWLGTQFKDAVNTSNKDFFHLDYGALAVGIGISVGREVKGVKTEVEQLRNKVKDLETKLSKYEQVWHN